MGDFDALYRLGFTDILTADGAVRLLEARAPDLVDRLLEALPDVVVLDEDKSDTVGLVQRIVHEFPSIRVIACSSERPTMRIFPAFHHGESYTSPLEPALLQREVRG